MNKSINILKRIFVLLLIIIFGFTLGCDMSDNKLLRVKDDDIETFENEPVIEKSKIDSVGVYLDATPSMEGYLGWHNESSNKDYPKASEEQENDYKQLVPLTVYEKSLQQINLFLGGNFDEEIITYYCADTTLWSAEKNNVLLEADKTGFYINSIYKGYTMVDEYAKYYSSEYLCPSISFAVENALKEDFSIIITDLYENEGNAYELEMKLQQIKKNRKEASVALIGIKSQYAGIVYDLMGDLKENYGVLEKTEKVDESSIKYRPFYIILIGNQDIVELFLNKFYINMNALELEVENVIFQDTKVYGVDYEDYAGYKSNKFNHIYEKDINIYNKESITEMRLVQMDKENLDDSEKIYLLYNITTDSLTKYLNTQKTEKGEPICISDEEFQRQVFDNWYLEQKPILTYSIDEEKFYDNSIKAAIKISNIYWLKDKNQLMLECDFDKNKVNSGIYKFSGKIFCRSTDDKSEKWIMDWNSSGSEFEGEKTQNLSNYYDAIRNTFSPEDKSIVCFSFYFRI